MNTSTSGDILDSFLGEPDTHCWDEDEKKDVWSYSREAVHAAILKALEVKYSCEPEAYRYDVDGTLWLEDRKLDNYWRDSRGNFVKGKSLYGLPPVNTISD